MRQFILPAEWDGGPTCRIQGGPARYLLRVLRLAPGDGFAGLDASGMRRDLVVLEAGEGSLLVSVGPAFEASASLEDTHGSRGRPHAGNGPLSGSGPLTGPALRAVGPGALPAGSTAGGATDIREDGPAQEAPASGIAHAGRKAIPRIVLAQGIAKGPAMDLIVRQAAEAGVARIIPLRTRRSVALGRGDDDGKAARWERIVREGLQQSGSPVRTSVEAAATVAELAGRLGPAPGKRLGLLLHELPLAQDSLHGYLGDAPEEVVLCVGPEGGFAPDEVDCLLKEGFRPLLLPGAILRAETAAIFAIASVETILSERSSWKPQA